MNESDDPAQAAATVTITLSREAAEWAYRELCGDNVLTPTPFHLCSEAEAAFSSALGIQHPGTQTPSAVGTLEAALSAAPPPAPSDDDLIGRERALIYRNGEVALYAYPIDFSLLFVQEVNGGRSNRLFVPALYCDAMIDALLLGKSERDRQQASLAAGRSAEEGT